MDINLDHFCISIVKTKRSCFQNHHFNFSDKPSHCHLWVKILLGRNVQTRFCLFRPVWQLQSAVLLPVQVYTAQVVCPASCYRLVLHTTVLGETEQSSSDSRAGHMRCSETVQLVTSETLPVIWGVQLILADVKKLRFFFTLLRSSLVNWFTPCLWCQG